MQRTRIARLGTALDCTLHNWRLLLWVLLIVPAQAQTWQSEPDLPTAGAARRFAAGFTYQGRVFALGGEPFAPSGDHDAPVHALAPGAAAWTIEEPIEGPIVRQCAGVDGLGRVVVFGGVDGIDPGGDEGSAYVYDLSEGQWYHIADPPAGTEPDHAACAVDSAGRVYALGGGPRDGGTPASPNSAGAASYDAGCDCWTVLTPMPDARADAAAAADGLGRILVIGGFDAAGQRTGLVQAFDVATGIWDVAGVDPLPVATSNACAVLGSDGRVYLIGGETAAGVSDETWALDPAAGTWSAGPALLTARKDFAASLGVDDRILVMGGDDGALGTAGAESLFTPPCPVFTMTPAGEEAYAGQSLVLRGAAVGAEPISYRWRLGGVDLVDGPLPGGGQVTGSASDTLLLTGLAPEDSGNMRLAATNACGTTISPVAPLRVRRPPDLDGVWRAVFLHPAGALNSSAYDVDGTRVAGQTSTSHPTYGVLGHPVVWEQPGAPPVLLTPPNSVGGGAIAVHGDLVAGWWWWPYNTPQGTGYHSHAALWDRATGLHHDVQPSGWEIGGLSATDGVHHVGTLRWDEHSTTVDGALFTGLSPSALILTPPNAWGSAANALFGERQFGSANLGFGVSHAAAWSGSPTSFVDMHPAGGQRSVIVGAGPGQQVGTLYVNDVPHAGLWGGDPAAFVDLHPPGAQNSHAVAVRAGVQVGDVASAGTLRAAAWSGSGPAWIDLHQVLPANYTSSAARGVFVSNRGHVRVVGYAYNASASRSEAVLWVTRDRAWAQEHGGPQPFSGAGG